MAESVLIQSDARYLIGPTSNALHNRDGCDGIIALLGLTKLVSDRTRTPGCVLVLEDDLEIREIVEIQLRIALPSDLVSRDLLFPSKLAGCEASSCPAKPIEAIAEAAKITKRLFMPRTFQDRCRAP